MNEIPLVQNVQKNDINTSIIAIKKQLKELNAMLGLIDVPSSDSPDMSPYVRKDEVVDVVRRFDQSPVTSNAVAESLSYSTTEQKTGGYWLDGKPIYIKTIDTGNLPNNTSKSIAHNILNLDRIIRLYGNAYRVSNKTFLPLPYSSTSSSGVIDVNVQNENIYIYTGTNRSEFIGYITLEYTKTTDQATHLMTTREFIEPMIKEILEEDK